MKIKDSVVLITGGASGLGEATVKRLTSQGAKVSIIDIKENNIDKIFHEYRQDVGFFQANIADETEVQNAVEYTVEKFGRIDIVINCAGIGAPKKVIEKSSPHPLELFNQIIQVNLIGTFNVIRLTAEKMLKNTPNEEGERGVIINTASIAAFDGQIGQASYSASKGGIVAMTLPIAREFAGYGIRVMTIAPGLFKTPLLLTLPDKVLEALGSMVPFPNRLGKTDEYALLAESIILNPMLNGETIRLDGAIRMQPK